MKKHMLFLKLILFFIIIAAVCFALYYFLDMPIMFYIMDGCVIAAAITFIAMLFKIFFMKDVEFASKQNQQEIIETNIQENWTCSKCGSLNQNQAKFCNNCGTEHTQQG